MLEEFINHHLEEFSHIEELEEVQNWQDLRDKLDGFGVILNVDALKEEIKALNPLIIEGFMEKAGVSWKELLFLASQGEDAYQELKDDEVFLELKEIFQVTDEDVEGYLK